MSENTLCQDFESERGNSMATGSSNANEGVSAVGDGTIHLILQGKGGVGDSVIASWLAEFLISSGRQVRCLDGDPVTVFNAKQIEGIPEWTPNERTVFEVVETAEQILMNSGATIRHEQADRAFYNR